MNLWDKKNHPYSGNETSIVIYVGDRETDKQQQHNKNEIHRNHTLRSTLPFILAVEWCSCKLLRFSRDLISHCSKCIYL